MTCPWSGYAPATIAFCERRLCAWVVEPSNAWSNLAYMLVGVWILWRCRPLHATVSTAIGVSALLLGLGSFGFHATGARVFEVADVSGMYILSALAVTFALQRLLGWPDAFAVAVFAATALGSILLMIALGDDGIVVFTVQVVAAAASEWHLRTRNPPGTGMWMVRAVATLVFAFVIWTLDFRGPLCDPDNHVLTGHAVWHVLTALAVLCFFRFHEAVRRT